LTQATGSASEQNAVVRTNGHVAEFCYLLDIFKKVVKVNFIKVVSRELSDDLKF
jgi:hypothetical protein